MRLLVIPAFLIRSQLSQALVLPQSKLLAENGWTMFSCWLSHHTEPSQVHESRQQDAHQYGCEDLHWPSFSSHNPRNFRVLQAILVDYCPPLYSLPSTHVAQRCKSSAVPGHLMPSDRHGLQACKYCSDKIIISNSSSGRLDVFFWPPWAMYEHGVQIHRQGKKDTHKIKIKPCLERML